MLRKLGMAVLTAGLTAPLVAAPVAAVEVAPAGEVEATAPAVARTDRNGDGLAEGAVVLPLTEDGRQLDIEPIGDADEHGHLDVALRSGTVALPSSPEMLILEDVPDGTHLAVRSHAASGWSDWTELTATADEAPDGARDARPGVGPIWVGDGAGQVEVALLEGDVDEVRVVGLHVVEEAEGVQGVRASAASTASPAQTSDGFIRPRSAWATSEMGWNCSTGPKVMPELRAMVVHHTAGNTAPYAESDVPAILRGIWRYHVGTNKWCDVAYAFFVDRFGGVWEGRQGGITKAIEGGHTYGFNSDTTSVAQIGHFDQQATPWAMTAATRQLVGWKLGLHGLDPAGTTTVTNRSGSTFRGTPNGAEHRTPVVSGHRDLRDTACPGANTYKTLPYIRAQSQTGAHVVALHEVFLRTLPSPEQYRRWLGVADRTSLHGVALGMARSAEYSGLIIDDLYQRVLGRPADDAGKRHWLGELAGGMRVEEVGAFFYGSPEYVAAAGSLEAYVSALYENLLHRAPDRSGLDHWTSQLRLRRLAPPDVAGGFYTSIESRYDRVARLYQTFLGRAPEAAGHRYWADELLDNDDVLLAVELSLSDEFYAKATS